MVERDSVDPQKWRAFRDLEDFGIGRRSSDGGDLLLGFGHQRTIGLLIKNVDGVGQRFVLVEVGKALSRYYEGFADSGHIVDGSDSGYREDFCLRFEI